MADSWQFSRSVIECNRYMLEHKIETDVTFVVSHKLQMSTTTPSGEPDRQDSSELETRTFEAHKYMLISRSPVFHAMLCGDMAEKGVITVEDVRPDAFQQMLNYIYLDDLELDKDVVSMVLYSSKKYLLPGLTDRCIHFLNQNLDVSNATLILDMALLFEEKKLADKCMTLIKINTKVALEVDSFLEVRLETLDYILGVDALSWEESSLFVRCIEWARRQCERTGVKSTGIELRKVLGKSLFKINFSNIRGPVFIKHVSPLKILTEREELKFLRHLTVKYDSSDAEECTDELTESRIAASPPKGFACQRLLRQIFEVSFNHRKEMVTKANEHFMFPLTLRSQFSFVIDSLELCSVSEYPYSGCRIMMVQPRLVVNDQLIQASFKDVIRKCDPEVMKSRRKLVMEEKVVILKGENKIDVSFKIYSDHGSGVNVCGVIKVLKGSKLQGKDKELVVPLEIESRDSCNHIPVYGITYRLNRDSTVL